jgi:hypothetical protein
MAQFFLTIGNLQKRRYTTPYLRIVTLKPI